MANKKQMKRLHAIHRAQIKLFRRTASAVQKEFEGEEVCEKFLAQVQALVAAVDRQSVAAEKLFTHADSLAKMPATADSANRSVMVIESLRDSQSGVSVFDYLDGMRKVAALIAEQEINWALGADVALRDKAKANPEDKKLKDYSDAMSWRLMSCQGQLHSLKRQAESITASEQALMRFRGLKFWQGRKCYLRWEGDREKIPQW